MKRTFFLAILLLAACQPKEVPAPASASSSHPSTVPAAKPMKVGLLTPGSVNDNGWNAIAYEGSRQIHERLGAEVSNQETKTPQEIAEGLRAYGVRKYDLVFGHGFEYQDPALEAGKQFPNTIYVPTSGSKTATNVAPMRFELEQATYLLGIIAARESKTGKAGLVGGLNLPSIASTFVAFKSGAQSVNPAFEVKEIYTGNFDDVGAAKLATQSLINSGCDFIFHQANEAGRGVFQACQEKKVRCFGSNKNQNDMAPDVIVASAVLDVPGAFVYMATLVRDKKFSPKVYHLGMNENVVSLVWNNTLKSTISPATVTAVEKVEADIRGGRFQVPLGKL